MKRNICRCIGSADTNHLLLRAKANNIIYYHLYAIQALYHFLRINSIIFLALAKHFASHFTFSYRNEHIHKMISLSHKEMNISTNNS
jgi:uncharacterized membrane protein